jgi:DNA invertase Pin-like site-specific DNA recombinase
MSLSETTNIIQKIAEFTGLTPLAIEVGFLLLISALLLIFILVVLAILRIRREMVRMNYTANYIARLLNRGYKDRQVLKITQGYYDFKPDEWREDTKQIVVAMLQQGKSYNEIVKKIDVTRAYLSETELWAKKEGFL